jgi:hypothetical protein
LSDEIVGAIIEVVGETVGAAVTGVAEIASTVASELTSTVTTELMGSTLDIIVELAINATGTTGSIERNTTEKQQQKSKHDYEAHSQK